MNNLFTKLVRANFRFGRMQRCCQNIEMIL